MSRLPIRRTAGQERTELARRDPFTELEELHRQLGRLLDSAFTDIGSESAWSPLVDVEETDDAWVVEAELPGVKRGDVTVEVSEGELVIEGELKERERKGILRRRTRRTGRFDYRVTLPGQVDADAVEANLDSGVLTVYVPKAEEARRRLIEIRGG